MNLSVLTALTASLLLLGCGSHPMMHRHAMAPDGDALHARPLLTVRQGLISVAPEPIVVSIRQQKDPIVWQLPAGYRFAAKNGIEVLGVVVGPNGRPLPPSQDALKDAAPRLDKAGATAFDCQVDAKDPGAFGCRFTARAVPGVYRYAIRVIDKEGKAIEWDPHVFAMD